MSHKMFEYLAAGCSVLASDFTLYRNLLQDSPCASFVDPQDVDQIARELKIFTTQNSLDFAIMPGLSEY